MNRLPTKNSRVANLLPKSDAELEAEAIADLERMGRALERKKSNYKPKRRGQYENSRR